MNILSLADVSSSLRSLAYYADLSDAIFIILRSGFEWIPFLGWVRKPH